MSILYDFLQRNTIEKSSSLPLVHTTRARHLRNILHSNKLIASPCDIFRGENLNYFFVGRPAYKFPLSSEAELWELPLCFILDYSISDLSKRVFPFDSGGFRRGKFPSYAGDHSLDSYDVARDNDADKKIIGTFFGSAHHYYKFKPKRDLNVIDRNEVSLLDSEVLALHKLSLAKTSEFDDRYFTIEVQSSEDVQLSNNKLLAVIVPAPYMDDAQFLAMAEKQWSCTLLSYDIYPIKPETYYYGIYQRIESFFRDRGYFG